jgi:hypothetical protein
MPYGQVLVDTVKDSLNNVLAPASSVFRNRLINGQFQISQYNGTSSATVVDGGMIIDRWKGLSIAQAGVFSAQQLSASPPVGYSNYLGFTSSGVTTPATGACFGMYQRIESFNTSDLAWGTANAKTVTLSFWVQASIAGTYTGSIVNSAQSYSYPFSYTISSANTWEQKSITIAGPTAGTWISGTNGTGVQIGFSIGTGATYAGTAGLWSANTFYAATGQTNLVGTSGATFYITGVQLEVGTNATSFDYRPYGTELALCQRYCYQINSDNAANGGATGLIGAGTGATSSGLARCQTFIPQMRTIPTLLVSNISGLGTDLRAYNGSSVVNVTGIVTNFSTINAVQFDANVSSAFTLGNVLTVLWQNNTTGGYIRLTAEL